MSIVDAISALQRAVERESFDGSGIEVRLGRTAYAVLEGEVMKACAFSPRGSRWTGERWLMIGTVTVRGPR